MISTLTIQSGISSGMTTGYRFPVYDMERKALKEACLRLAWYVTRYGGIPEKEQIRLALFADGFRRDEEGLVALAHELEQHFAEMNSGSS